MKAGLLLNVLDWGLWGFLCKISHKEGEKFLTHPLFNFKRDIIS